MINGDFDRPDVPPIPSIMNVALVSVAITAPGEALVAGVSALRRAGATVHLISRTAPTPALAAALDGVTPLAGPWPQGRPGVAVGTPTTGLTRWLSKLRFDPARLLGTARLGRLDVLLVDCDVLVAVEPAAVPAVWFCLRHRPALTGLNGLPAAVARYG